MIRLTNEVGKAVEIIYTQTEKRQVEKQNLKAELAKEKIFFERFRKGDINNIKFRRASINTFICNAQEYKIEVYTSDSKCSPM